MIAWGMGAVMTDSGLGGGGSDGGLGGGWYGGCDDGGEDWVVAVMMAILTLGMAGTM